MRRRALLFALCLLTAFSAGCSPGPGDARPSQEPEARAACRDVAERGSLRVLTLNLHFSAVRDRDRRLRAIGDFIAAEAIDVVLLQEVAAGLLVRSRSTALELQDLLRDRHGLVLDERSAVEDGVPGLLTVANAVLSRCLVLDERAVALPEIAELGILGFRFRLGRNVLMTRLLVPEIGEIDVYNTHLCASCTAKERRRQLEAALSFIEKNDREGERPVIFGGDLNLDLERDGGAEKALYALIEATGLRDTATMDGEAADRLCAQPEKPDRYCTVGVAEPIRPQSRRIDYLFARDVGAIAGYRTVFNPRIDPGQPAVSNHAGVVAELMLVSAAAPPAPYPKDSQSPNRVERRSVTPSMSRTLASVSGRRSSRQPPASR